MRVSRAKTTRSCLLLLAAYLNCFDALAWGTREKELELSNFEPSSKGPVQREHAPSYVKGC